jgi:hypothetical protein
MKATVSVLNKTGILSGVRAARCVVCAQSKDPYALHGTRPIAKRPCQ